MLGASLEPNSQNQHNIFDLVCFEPDHSVKCSKLCLILGLVETAGLDCDSGGQIGDGSTPPTGV